MNSILVGGAGGAPSEGVIKSLLLSERHEDIVGMGSVPSDLILSAAKKKYIVPYSNTIMYKDKLMEIIRKERPALVHFQNDLEVYHASLIRDDIVNEGTKVFMPKHEVIETCVNKWKTWCSFKKAGLVVPDSLFIKDKTDLKEAFDGLGDKNGEIWLRSNSIGGGGIGALSTNDYELARAWIDRQHGWGNFIAAEKLSSKTITWLSIWWNGELVVAQTRKRTGWIHGNRAASGVTGVTKIGTTCSDRMVTKIAIQSIKAVDASPHGIFGVDMTYDKNGVPNPTEINIARFFTTIYFFTKAGLNMPLIYKDIAIYGELPKLRNKINPLPNGLIWLRAMDRDPMLLTMEELNKGLIKI